MVIEKNKVVSVSYELRTHGKEGEIVDLAYEESPLQFIYGIGMMLPKFEENLSNLKVNDTFDFMLTSEEGYGERNEEMYLMYLKTYLNKMVLSKKDCLL
jgi:FKBP-type peptidyl-prolyl cis-trans isomerase SlyD